MVCTTLTVTAQIPSVTFNSGTFAANGSELISCTDRSDLIGKPIQEIINLTSSANAIIDIAFHWLVNGVDNSAGVQNYNINAGTSNYLFNLLGNYAIGTYTLGPITIANIRSR